jgi:hypothetical protein
MSRRETIVPDPEYLDEAGLPWCTVPSYLPISLWAICRDFDGFVGWLRDRMFDLLRHRNDDPSVPCHLVLAAVLSSVRVTLPG